MYIHTYIQTLVCIPVCMCVYLCTCMCVVRVMNVLKEDGLVFTTAQLTTRLLRPTGPAALTDSSGGTLAPLSQPTKFALLCWRWFMHPSPTAPSLQVASLNTLATWITASSTLVLATLVGWSNYFVCLQGIYVFI